MSADKRRKILIGFAGLAVILVVVITYVSPTFRNENASGAIAPVQKHRAPQIAQSDVVLGNEQFKQEQQIVYGDYLTDASELRSISALGLKNGLDNAGRRLDAHRAAVQVKYAENMVDAVGIVSRLARESGLENVEADAASLQAMLAAKQAYSNEEMEVLNLKLQKAVHELSAADAVANYEQIRQDLGRAASLYEQKSAYKAEEALEKASSRLAALSTLNLTWRLNHLDALAAENKAIENASSRLSLANAEEFSATLGKAADDLQAKAMDNMRRFAASNSAFEAALNQMSATVDKISRLAENRASVEMISRAVARHSSELEARQAAETLAQQEALSVMESRNRALASAMR
jgi:hypothetical protein